MNKHFPKSKHKHEYVECFFKFPVKIATIHYYIGRGSYCKICGKIKNVVTVHNSNEGYTTFMEPEIVKKFPDLPLFNLNSMYDKYIPEQKEGM